MTKKKSYVKNFLDEDRKEFEVQGRIIRKRDLGGIIFATIKDQTGTAQIAFDKKHTGDNYRDYGNLNVGDVIYIIGTPFITRNGTKTLGIKSTEVIARCREPFPDKYHSLSRKTGQINRGLELMVDQNSMDLFLRRNNIFKEIRRFLFEREFQEVDTGILQQSTNTSPSGDFITHSDYFGRDLFLRKTPELRLKQLLVSGMENIFELGKNFRNEGVSRDYHPEYTILELYQNGATYLDMLDLTKSLLSHLNEEVYTPINNPMNATDVSLYEFVLREIRADVRDLTIDQIKTHIAPEIRKEYGQEPIYKGLYIYDLFRTLLKRYSNENIILHGVPKEISILGKTFENDPTLVEEFRYFVRGNLICNGITELTDYNEQKRRIEQQAKMYGKNLDTSDMKFLETLKFGLPHCAGLGLGVEKTLMVYLETEDIRDVIYFPL